MPSLVAMAAASILVTMPPEPTWLPDRETSTPSSAAIDAHLVDELRSRPSRLAGVQPVDVGQQHERVSVHQVRDQRGEPIVVAEADLVRRHGVVLVDDRDHAEREQPLQRALGVAVVAPAMQVVGGEQHLTRR